jgi:uncharacterized membrane protein
MPKDFSGATAQESFAPSSEEGLKDESRLFGAISYVFGVFIAIIIYLLKKDDGYVRFHAAQAILFDISLMVVSIAMFALMFVLMIVAGIATMGIGFILGFWVLWLAVMVVALGAFLVRLYFAFMAYSGKRFKLPLIGVHAANIAAG